MINTYSKETLKSEYQHYIIVHSSSDGIELTSEERNEDKEDNAVQMSELIIPNKEVPLLIAMLQRALNHREGK